MAIQIQVRRGTAAQWTSADPTMASGEVGFETDTGKFKIGDGSTAWSALSYFETGAGSGTVDTSGTPVANDIARFTDADTIEGLSYTELRSAINVEDGATADQTGAEIKSAYEGENDTNAFTDALLSKLNAIEASADVTDTANVTSAGALMDSEVDADIKTLSLPANTTITAFAATLLDDADAATARTTLGVGSGSGDVVGPGSATDNAIVRFDSTTGKLVQNSGVTIDDSNNISGIGSVIGVGSTGGVTSTGSVIFTSDSGGTPKQVIIHTSGAIVIPSTIDGRDLATDGSKLDNIEANADVTDTANVTSAGALMDSEVDADLKTFSLPANTTISAFGATLVDDADAATARSTLGAGTMSDLVDDTSPTLGGALDGDGNTISNYLNAYNNQTGTTYTFVAGDRGKVVTFNNAGSITATVPDTLSAGWTVTIIQLGAGQVTVSTSGSMNLRNRQSHTKLAGQYAMGTLAVYASNNVSFGGDTAS